MDDEPNTMDHCPYTIGRACRMTAVDVRETQNGFKGWIHAHPPKSATHDEGLFLFGIPKEYCTR